METASVSGDTVRIPAVSAGTATLVSRYGKERAFVLHPDDFHRLAELETLVAGALELPPLTIGDTALVAHVEEDTPDMSLTDPAALQALLGE